MKLNVKKLMVKNPRVNKDALDKARAAIRDLRKVTLGRQATLPVSARPEEVETPERDRRALKLQY